MPHHVKMNDVWFFLRDSLLFLKSSSDHYVFKEYSYSLVLFEEGVEKVYICIKYIY